MFESQFVTYAQNGEDVLLWRALRGIHNGFYIDVGAQDPVVDSVTKAFYDRGWRGINIEPVPRWHERLVAARPHDINLRVAVSSEPGTVTLFEVENTGLSTSDAEFAQRYAEEGRTVRKEVVDCVTLDRICADHHVDTVHFLKVDCEGAEKQVLESIALTDVRPWVILVEATEPNSATPTWHLWDHLLTDRHYRFVFFDGLNRYYVATEHADLAAAFGAPVNVFDSARRAADLSTEQQRDRLQQEIECLKGAATVARLERGLADTMAERDWLKEERARLQSEQATLRGALVVAKAEHDKLASELRQSQIDSGRLRQDLASANHKADVYAREAGVYHREVGSQRDQLNAQCERIDALTGEIAELRASRSWRITAPLRASGRAARRSHHGLCHAARVFLLPFAHALRPLLRLLAGSRFARQLVTGTLGKHSDITNRARAFLFHARPAGGNDTVVAPMRATDSLSVEAEVSASNDDGVAIPFDLDTVMERVRAEVSRRSTARASDAHG